MVGQCPLTVWSVVSSCTVIACVSLCPLKHAWQCINDRVRGDGRVRAADRAHDRVRGDGRVRAADRAHDRVRGDGRSGLWVGHMGVAVTVWC